MATSYLARYALFRRPNDGAAIDPCLGFEDIAAAKEIFAGLKAKLGSVDVEERLRLTIIVGVNKNEPNVYNAVVGTNFSDAQSGQMVLSVAQICTMKQQIPGNMERFAKLVKEVSRFTIVPVELSAGSNREAMNLEFGIELKTLNVREAWEIGEHDRDSMGIRLDDDPIIPPDIHDAPVEKMLSQRRSRRRPS
jgi:hypothetical protein